MKKIKICSVVVGTNIKEFLKNLDRVQETSEMIELRVDKIIDFKEKDLILIRNKTKKEAILTCRTKKIFLEVLDLGFEYVDIDLDVIEEEQISFSKKLKTKIILSFHDFDKTPPEWFLRKLIWRMENYNPDIIKIASFVKEDYDNLKLFRLMLNKKSEEKRIIIGMGEKGKITRILGPTLGNYLTYASTDYGQSALGQINIEKLKQIYQLIY